MNLTLKLAKKIMQKNNGTLDLSNTQITHLPEGLSVEGSLYLFDTPILSLPENLTVGGSLDLSDTLISNLPEGLTVGGWLNLDGTLIRSVPERLYVGDKIYGKKDCNLQYNQLKNGEYIPGKYLYVNNILTHIQRSESFNGYTLYVGKIKGKNVVSDGKDYVFCQTFEQGIDRLKGMKNTTI